VIFAKKVSLDDNVSQELQKENRKIKNIVF
jgi:hypothetical protein